MLLHDSFFKVFFASKENYSSLGNIHFTKEIFLDLQVLILLEQLQIT